jgi:hypothetical protein
MSAARVLECPILAINSRRLALSAASMVPVCRRSWKCSPGTPAASTAFRQVAFIGESSHTGEEAASYAKITDRLWTAAAEQDAARRLIIRAADDLPR